MENEIFKLADKLKDLRSVKKQVEEELKFINKTIDETDQRLTELMISNETQSFNRSGTLFYLNTKIYASAAGEKKEELFEALKKQGYGTLVVETVNANSLSAFVKEQILENEDLLPNWLEGKVNVFERTTVGVRKA
ncbi:hypothetical protein [Youngiibacter multivorans]